MRDYYRKFLKKGTVWQKGRDNLHRRENGIFAFSYKDAAGIWREKYTGTVDRGEAKQLRQQFLDELSTGKLPIDMADWRLNRAIKWWNEFRQPRIVESTGHSEPYRLQHLPRVLGNKRLREITNRDLDEYVTARLAVPVGAWSINKEIQLWSLILTKAKLWHRLAEDYRPLKTRVSDIGRALSREQLCHLAEVAQTNREWEAAFYGSVLAANTGLRGGEIKRLTIASIDVDRRRIKIFCRDTKSDASARFVELNRDATEAAARLLLRAESLGSNQPEHYLMPKNLSRISYGKHKGGRGYDPLQHQEAWDTSWASLTE